MSEGKSQLQKLLDLLVYAPAGLAQSAAEEFERLSEKGRHRVEGQLHTARLVGQFAVQMARREAEKGLRDVFGKVTGGSEGTGPDATARADEGSQASFGEDRAPEAVWSDGSNDRTGPERQLSVAGANGAESSSHLAIPGYDSLSASHVVQRLGGLSHDELQEVRDHELAHRHRRTILNRVDQLLSDGGAEAGTLQS